LNRTLTDTAAVDANAPRAANDASYLQAIQRQLANGTAGLTRRGVSDQYDQLATGAAGDASDYAGTVAGLLSRIDAGTQLRQNERTIASDFGYDVAPIGGDIQGDEFLTRLRMGGVRRNPYVDLLAGAAQGVGNAYSARGA
jgi:hypothetical protein